MPRGTSLAAVRAREAKKPFGWRPVDWGQGWSWAMGCQTRSCWCLEKADSLIGVQCGRANCWPCVWWGRERECRRDRLGQKASPQDSMGVWSERGLEMAESSYFQVCVHPELCAQPAVINHLGYLTSGVCSQFLFPLIHLFLVPALLSQAGACSDLST